MNISKHGRLRDSEQIFNWYSCRQLFATSLLLVLSQYQSVQAEEQSVKPDSSTLRRLAEQDYLFGTWGGARTKLAEKGIDFEFVYFGAVPSNVEGGIETGSVYEGAVMMLLDLHTEKLFGLEGGQFHAGGLNIHSGEEFSRFHIGDLNKVSLLDYPDDFRLWELWYEQKFLAGKVSLKLGQLAIDRDFILPEFFNSIGQITFLNQTFFYPTLAFNVYDIEGLSPGDHALASTPYGAPGIRLRVDPIPQAYVQAGVYDGNPDRTRGGVRINLNDQEGALAYFEVGYKLNQGKDDEGLPGNYKIGAYYHTDDFVDVNEGVFAAFGLLPSAENHSGNYGAYLLIDQYLFREAGKDDQAQQGLVGFSRVAGAPPDRNLTQLEIAGGLVYRGAIPGRDWDTVGVAGSYLEISDDLADAFSTLGLPRPDYEGVVEWSYRAQLTAWWSLQTSVQYVWHPGGRTAPIVPPIDDALAVIVQTVIRF